MLATVINAVLVLAGSFIGLLAKNRISEKVSRTIVGGLALCVMVIGVMNAVGTADILIVIICLVIGTILGELLRIEDRINWIGNKLKHRFDRGGSNGSFTEGFVSASLLFCVGSMAIMGSIDAGIRHDYSVILSKSIIDAVTAVTLAAGMGIGVAFSAAAVLVYQGAITMLAAWIGPYLGEAVIAEMSAVGGVMLIGIAINMMDLKEDELRVANMLPAIFLPIGLVPLADWLGTLI